MTVINMLSFGDSGVAVADEQSSTNMRKYNVAQKLHLLDNKIVYGGSGSSDALATIYEDSNNKLMSVDGQRSIDDAAISVNGSMIKYRNELKNNVLLANMGVTLADLTTGFSSKYNRALDADAKASCLRFLQQADNIGNVGVLIGGMKNEKFEIYAIDSSGTNTKISRPYQSIGSGSDESDKVLSSYVINLSREKRDKIDKKEGLVKVIEATNSSSKTNQGVGGSPSIAYITKDSVIIPSENQCILASEIVDGLTNNFLDKDFSEDLVYSLVVKNESFEESEEKMKSSSKNWKDFDRFLRGYKK